MHFIFIEIFKKKYAPDIIKKSGYLDEKDGIPKSNEVYKLLHEPDERNTKEAKAP